MIKEIKDMAEKMIQDKQEQAEREDQESSSNTCVDEREKGQESEGRKRFERAQREITELFKPEGFVFRQQEKPHNSKNVKQL